MIANYCGRIIAVVVMLGAAACGYAQDKSSGYPSRPVRLIVTVPAGAGNDTVTRAAAQMLSDKWGQSVVVDNRPGAGSVIGEQSFFDGQPRSANVWAVTDGELLCLTGDQFRVLSDSEPVLARDLLFALGRVLSLRLRNTTVRIRR